MIAVKKIGVSFFAQSFWSGSLSPFNFSLNPFLWKIVNNEML